MNAAVLSEPTLLLNKHCLPIRVCTVPRALTIVFKELARPTGTDDDGRPTLYAFSSWADLKVAKGEPCIHSVSFSIRIPEVIVLHLCDRYTKPRVVFSRRNLFRRDRNTCQY